MGFGRIEVKRGLDLTFNKIQSKKTSLPNNGIAPLTRWATFLL